MSEVSSHPVGSSGQLPEVRLEVRQGTSRPLLYEITDLAFLVGCVAGCDLRVSSPDVPPLACMIVRGADSLTVRRLTPTMDLLLNGQPLASDELVDGDRITIGALDLVVHAQFPFPAQSTNGGDTQTFSRGAVTPDQDLEERARGLEVRQRQLEEQAQALQAERDAWQGRRQEIEREQRLLQQLQHDFADASAKLRQREEAVRLAEQGIERQHVHGRKDGFADQDQEAGEVRRELASVRHDLYDRYRVRRDRLAGLQEAINRAAEKVQERKGQVDAEASELSARVAELDARAEALRQLETSRREELDARAADLDRIELDLEQLEHRLREREKELRERLDGGRLDLGQQEAQLATTGQELATKRLQYEADVIRLDRLASSLEERHRQAEERAQQVDQRYEQMQRDSRDMEEQARQLDEWHAKLCSESEQLQNQRVETEAQASDSAKRASDLESQQAMLASLRTRLERMREDIGRGERHLIDQRVRQEQAEADLKAKAEELEQLRTELEQSRQAQIGERHALDERRAQVDSGERNLRQVEERLAAEEEQLRLRAAALEARAAQEAESTAVLQARSAQLLQLQERLGAGRQSLRERDAALAQAESARETLQEQLRRRGEELNERLLALAERERQQAQAAGELESHRFELERRAAEQEQQNADLAERDRNLHRHVERLKESGRTIGAARKALVDERAQWRVDQEQAAVAAARQRAELDSLREEAAELQRQLPEWEEQARTAAEQLSGVRAQLREHLAQLHGYIEQGQGAFEAARLQLQTESEQIHQQATGLDRAREEHRLAVAAFRQQLIAWQGQITDMKRGLTRDESRLEQRHAEVEATSVRLAQQAEQLQLQEREVSQRRDEVERHLAEMREWYRKKLRELSERQRSQGDDSAFEGPSTEAPAEQTAAPGILQLTGPVSAGDRQLGDLLQSLELVEADTLTALLVEARRQKQTLRQVLLASGYVTLYQLALIEAGNLDGLVLGPVRVLDRLRSTARETVYQVFDPRRADEPGAGEAVLRHLAEAEMQDAVHPDEFRQRFQAAAAVQHPNLLSTWEVIEINERPAVLQEWLTGLVGSDWPALVTVSGVWYRLVSQVALGLNAAHEAGLVHGRLDASRLLLTSDGLLKICGFGEPPWLAMSEPPRSEPTAADDVAAVARLATRWATMPLPRPKGGKPKPLAEPLQPILQRLAADSEPDRYPSARALLDDLDSVSGTAPVNPEAWNRFLRLVRERSGGDLALRHSA